MGSGYYWGDDDPSGGESALCEVIPFPQGADSLQGTWSFSRSDALFAVALTGIVTAVICLAPAVLSLIS